VHRIKLLDCLTTLNTLFPVHFMVINTIVLQLLMHFFSPDRQGRFSLASFAYSSLASCDSKMSLNLFSGCCRVKMHCRAFLGVQDMSVLYTISYYNGPQYNRPHLFLFWKAAFVMLLTEKRKDIQGI
jgi:hypothetical protein